MTQLELRAATAADISTVAGIFARSRAAHLPFLPVLHTAEEDLRFFAHYLDAGRITLAMRDGISVGFLAEKPGWIEQLYLEPDQVRSGIGRLLVDDVKQRHPKLQLWCFAQNTAALAFYQRQGFSQIGGTAGDNEEQLPDVLLAWSR